MFVHLTRKHRLSTFFAAALLLAATASAQTKSNGDLAKIRIKNFGRTNDNYYRGAQPDVRDYPDLAALGVKTVIDLTRDGRTDEQGLVQHAGMKFYRIPLTTSEQPSEAAVTQFLKLVNDPANLPVFVHCQGGRHRTGVMTAVYRMTKDGWNPDRAYDEMKQFHFEGFPGHPVLRQFIYDYYKQFGVTHQVVNEQTEKAAGASK
jgi:protein tyrosine/serine phosphatase